MNRNVDLKSGYKEAKSRRVYKGGDRSWVQVGVDGEILLSSVEEETRRQCAQLTANNGFPENKR